VSTHSPLFFEIYDTTGASRGLLVGPELWAVVKAQVLPLLEQAASRLEPLTGSPTAERPEPMDDWAELLASWDFPYPPSPAVTCAHCGNTTEDWTGDTPRKFRLRAANVGGLATFQCQSCRALILKKHFKTHMAVECQPFVSKG